MMSTSSHVVCVPAGLGGLLQHKIDNTIYKKTYCFKSLLGWGGEPALLSGGCPNWGLLLETLLLLVCCVCVRALVREIPGIKKL